MLTIVVLGPGAFACGGGGAAGGDGGVVGDGGGVSPGDARPADASVSCAAPETATPVGTSTSADGGVHPSHAEIVVDARAGLTFLYLHQADFATCGFARAGVGKKGPRVDTVFLRAETAFTPGRYVSFTDGPKDTGARGVFVAALTGYFAGDACELDGIALPFKGEVRLTAVSATRVAGSYDVVNVDGSVRDVVTFDVPVCNTPAGSWLEQVCGCQ